jgi:hypothetical protein
MRQNAVAQTLRCGSSQPSQFHARRRQSLTFSLPAPFPEAGFGRQVMFVDSRCPAGRLRYGSGGRVRAVASVRQTGNSGVNPGRPRRCDRAIFGVPRSLWPAKRRPAVFEPLRSCRCRRRDSREGCSRRKPESQKTYQVSGVCRTARAERRARPRTRPVVAHAQDPLLQAPASFPGRACACMRGPREGVCACQAVVPWMSARGCGGAECRSSNCSSWWRSSPG